MLPRRFIALCALALLVATAPQASATSVQPPEFEALVKQADYVVRGVVKSVTSEWRHENGHRYIASKVEIDVKEVIRGTPPTPLVLDMVGGRVGEDELVVNGAPRFAVGDEDILFLKANDRMVTPLVGVMHGRYPIVKDQRGETLAVRSNGMPLYSEQDVSLPLHQINAARARYSIIKPMNAAAFIGKIRSVSDLTPSEPNAK